MNSTLTLVHAWSPVHAMHKCTIRDLLQMNVTNWQYNRPPDLIRVADIANKVIVKSASEPVDWVFSMFRDETGTFHVVDGIHRYTALKYIYTENHKPVDYLTPNVFGHDGNANWLYDKYVMIIIRETPSVGAVVDWYRAINSSHPVSELYIQSSSNEKRALIEMVVKEWMTKYRQHFSSSLRPIQGNTNRELFTELLSALYDRLEITDRTQYKLYEMLDALNTYVRTVLPKKYTDNALKKCVASGCFLFLYKNDQLLL